MKSIQRKCTESYHVIKGVVVDGIGEGAKYVRLYSSIIKEVLGLEPYPGTLNIELNDDDKKLLYGLTPFKFIPPPMGEFCGALSWKVFVRFKNKCVHAYALKPEKTVHRDNVIELISDRYLRGALGVKSGDIVEIILVLEDSNPCYCL